MPTIQSVTSAVIAARRVGDGYARFDSRQASAETPGGGGALRKLRRVRSSDRIMKTSGRLVRTSSPKVTASPYSRAFVSRTPATPWPPPDEGCEASESGAAGSHVADEAALSMGEEWPPSKPSGAACGGLRGVLGLRAGTSVWGLEPWDLRRWCLSHGWAGATCATCGSWPFLSSRLSWLELWWTPPKVLSQWGERQHHVHADWSGLFFDLVFVGVAFQLGAFFNYSFFYRCSASHPCRGLLETLLWSAAIFVSMLRIWSTEVAYRGRLVATSRLHRLLDLATYFLLFVAASNIRPLQDWLGDAVAGNTKLIACFGPIMLAQAVWVGRWLEVALLAPVEAARRQAAEILVDECGGIVVWLVGLQLLSPGLLLLCQTASREREGLRSHTRPLTARQAAPARRLLGRRAPDVPRGAQGAPLGAALSSPPRLAPP